MFYNSRKLKEIKLGDITLKIKPFDCYQQIEYIELANKTIDDKKKIPDLAIWCMENIIQVIDGMLDEDGNAIDYATFDKKELCAGLTLGFIHAILDAVYDACKLPDDIKKKS